MAAKKPNRQQMKKKQAARAARATEAARRRRVRQRRRTVASVVAVVAAVGLLGAFLLTRSPDTTDVATTSSSTTPASSTPSTALPSAAGKPCVPAAGPLPAGAPAVPVKVGPPPTTLIAEDLKAGTGPVVAPGANLTVHYIGVTCSTGKVFDSSYSRKQPAQLPLSGVIPGWQKGIPGMAVGGQRLLGIPPELGYGATGKGRDIGPQETLWFVVEVLDAKAAAPS